MPLLALTTFAKWLFTSRGGHYVLAVVAICAVLGWTYHKGSVSGAAGATDKFNATIERSEELISHEEAAAVSAADDAARRVCERASDPKSCFELVRGRR